MAKRDWEALGIKNESRKITLSSGDGPHGFLTKKHEQSEDRKEQKRIDNKIVEISDEALKRAIALNKPTVAKKKPRPKRSRR